MKKIILILGTLILLQLMFTNAEAAGVSTNTSYEQQAYFQAIHTEDIEGKQWLVNLTNSTILNTMEDCGYIEAYDNDNSTTLNFGVIEYASINGTNCLYLFNMTDDDGFWFLFNNNTAVGTRSNLTQTLYYTLVDNGIVTNTLANDFSAGLGRWEELTGYVNISDPGEGANYTDDEFGNGTEVIGILNFNPTGSDSSKNMRVGLRPAGLGGGTEASIGCTTTCTLQTGGVALTGMTNNAWYFTQSGRNTTNTYAKFNGTHFEDPESTGAASSMGIYAQAEGWLYANLIGVRNTTNNGTEPYLSIGEIMSGSWDITAVELTNNITITSFNVTINGTSYNTTDGKLETGLETNGSYYNMTFENNEDFEYISIYQIDGTFEMGLNQEDLTVEISVSYNNYTQNNATMTCTVTNPTSLSYNTTYWINNSNEGWEISQYENNTYESNLTNFQDEIDLWCMANTTYKNENSTKYNIPNDTINTQYTFNANSGYDGTLITNVIWEFLNASENRSSNPLVIDATYFINRTNKSQYETLNIYDLNYYHAITVNNVTAITEEQIEYNYTMIANNLTLNFMQNGNTYTASGRIYNRNLNENFTDTVIAYEWQNFTVDTIVTVEFGKTSTSTDWRQFYEYQNEWGVTVNETVEVLNDTTNTIWVQISLLGAQAVEDAIINATLTNYVNNTDAVLFGRRITKSDGLVYFNTDPYSNVYFEVTKEGYQTTGRIIDGNQTQYTQTSPLIITIAPEDVTLSEYNRVSTVNTFSNRSQNINATILASYTDAITYTTQYAIDQGITNTTATEENNVWHILLISGTHFSSTTSTDDIELLVYADGTLVSNTTISYDSTTRTELLNPDETTQIEGIIVLTIFILSAGIGIMFKDVSIGIGALFITSIIASLITSATVTTWLLIITGVYLVVKTIRGFMD